MRCVAFRCICNVLILHGTRCKMGWTCAINAQVCAIKSHWNFFATNAPDPPHWTLNSCFCGFRSVWVHLSMFRHYTNLGAKGLNWCNQCTSLCHKVASEFFTTNAPNPPHWTLNSCFGAFRSVGCIWQCFFTT